MIFSGCSLFPLTSLCVNSLSLMPGAYIVGVVKIPTLIPAQTTDTTSGAFFFPFACWGCTLARKPLFPWAQLGAGTSLPLPLPFPVTGAVGTLRPPLPRRSPDLVAGFQAAGGHTLSKWIVGVLTRAVPGPNRAYYVSALVT